MISVSTLKKEAREFLLLFPSEFKHTYIAGKLGKELMRPYQHMYTQNEQQSFFGKYLCVRAWVPTIKHYTASQTRLLLKSCKHGEGIIFFSFSLSSFLVRLGHEQQP